MEKNSTLIIAHSFKVFYFLKLRKTRQEYNFKKMGKQNPHMDLHLIRRYYIMVCFTGAKGGKTFFS